MTFRFTAAGESHGRGLVGILEGIPAGLPVSAADVDVELKRRMGGYGRGARMKIESDRIEWLAGVRAGETLGSPIAMLIWNRDWEHWQDVMAPGPWNGAAGRGRGRCRNPGAGGEVGAGKGAGRAAGAPRGGIGEVTARGAPVGLGSHVSGKRKREGGPAGALMSIPAVKGVE